MRDGGRNCNLHAAGDICTGNFFQLASTACFAPERVGLNSFSLPDENKGRIRGQAPIALFSFN
jgi:hypothetical protein